MSAGGVGPVRLYLVRHAIAARRGPEWPDDSTRPLTRRGIERMRAVVGGMRALGVRPEVIAASPFARADHTARLLAEGLGGRPALVTLSALSPGQEPGTTVDAIRSLPAARSVALVGHEPDLGRLAAWLLGTGEPPRFKKGGVCCLDVGAGLARARATLVWMATPRMLRGLGR